MGASLIDTANVATESAEQDQTARMCRLILLYTFRKINPQKRPVGQGFNVQLEQGNGTIEHYREK